MAQLRAKAYYSQNGHVLPRIYGRYPYYLHRRNAIEVDDDEEPLTVDSDEVTVDSDQITVDQETI